MKMDDLRVSHGIRKPAWHDPATQFPRRFSRLWPRLSQSPRLKSTRTAPLPGPIWGKRVISRDWTRKNGRGKSTTWGHREYDGICGLFWRWQIHVFGSVLPDWFLQPASVLFPLSRQELKKTIRFYSDGHLYCIHYIVICMLSLLSILLLIINIYYYCYHYYYLL